MARTGRPPEGGEALDAVICVRFTQSERTAIDASRGTQVRSEFIREAVSAALSRAKK